MSVIYLQINKYKTIKPVTSSINAFACNQLYSQVFKLYSYSDQVLAICTWLFRWTDNATRLIIHLCQLVSSCFYCYQPDLCCPTMQFILLFLATSSELIASQVKNVTTMAGMVFNKCGLSPPYNPVNFSSLHILRSDCKSVLYLHENNAYC